MHAGMHVYIAAREKGASKSNAVLSTVNQIKLIMHLFATYLHTRTDFRFLL